MAGIGFLEFTSLQVPGGLLLALGLVAAAAEYVGPKIMAANQSKQQNVSPFGSPDVVLEKVRNS